MATDLARDTGQVLQVFRFAVTLVEPDENAQNFGVATDGECAVILLEPYRIIRRALREVTRAHGFGQLWRHIAPRILEQ